MLKSSANNEVAQKRAARSNFRCMVSSEGSKMNALEQDVVRARPSPWTFMQTCVAQGQVHHWINIDHKQAQLNKAQIYQCGNR